MANLLFRLKLSLFLSLFLLQALWELKQKAVLATIVVVLALLNSWAFFIRLQAQKVQVIEKKANLSEIEQAHQEALKNQPTHRDLLYNLSVLKNESQYLDEARAQDPNSDLFRN